ncbi:MAG: SusD/RagB family nutrient-binding outer membrane lipoprotein [Microscillaceae bacterium]|jgi:hypothetical protein|nr:SusD/RagB family nutrient-binding outer membrane lipoprotein [Microscillaceae bacterium]
MKSILIYISIFVLGATLLWRCDFGDLNVDPTSPRDAPMNVILPAAQANLIYGIHGDISQFTSIFTQQIGGIENIYLSVGQYDLNSNLAGRVWEGNLYPGAMMDLNIIIRKATDQNAPHYRGVARVLMASALGQCVDLWNNVPFNESFRGNDPTPLIRPAYQPGQVLYDTIQNMLSSAIVDLQATTSTVSPGRDDLVYGGNRTRWVLAARALKARYFNHLSKLNATTSANNALAQIQAGSFANNSEDARVVFGNTPDAAGPWFRFLVGSFGNGVRAGQFMVTLMQGKNDPRLPFYFRGPTFTGAPAGTSAPSASPIGGYYNRPEAPANLVTFVELKFIEAEANFRLGNLAAAATAHNAAVAASIAKTTASLPALNLTTNATANAAYIAAYGNENETSITLEKILIEKYLALFLEPETWTDWRRSISPTTPNGIPALAIAANSNQFTSGVFPRRWPYPQSEIVQNSANVNAQGSARITDRIFWDQ